MKLALPLFILLILLVPGQSLKAQENQQEKKAADSIPIKMHSPTKATLMSACLPGLGQIYNRKYWKVPVIYAGFGILSYFIYFNTDQYLDYKCAYIEKSYGNTAGNYSYLVNRYSSEELLSAREYYRRNLEVTCLLTALWYVLNILDATVDAHLYTYNISKDLSLKIDPALLPAPGTTGMGSGLRLSFRF